MTLSLKETQHAICIKPDTTCTKYDLQYIIHIFLSLYVCLDSEMS